MMYLEQEKPYRPLLTALIFAALPLALLIHDVFSMIAGGGGLLFGRQDGGWSVAKGWNDSAVWLVAGVFFFFNLLIAAVLVKAALKKCCADMSAMRCFSPAWQLVRLPPFA